MTQLDLPPISFARYLDLLKRRRWQVIPVSLLGMVVGGLVAFFVPRYYVAETTIKYTGAVLESDDGTPDDPMLGIVAAARLTIPATVPAVLQELAWPEALDEDEDARRAFAAAVRSELQVLDLNVDTRGRRFASLKIAYRDTRADRVAAFPNMLRDMWILNQETRLTERANLERRQLTQQMAGANRDLNNARDELRQYQQRNRINPMEGARSEARESSRLSDEHREVEGRVAELLAAEQKWSGEAATYRLTLADMPRRVPDTEAVSPVLANAIQSATVQLVEALNALKYISEAHDNHPLRTRQAAMAQERLEQLRAQSADEQNRPQNLVENADYEETQDLLLEAEAQLAGIVGQLERERARLRELNDRLDQLPGIWQGYEELLGNRDNAKLKVTQLTTQQSEQSEMYERITYQQPIDVLQQAIVPPRPTEPNITLVALTGSVLGLALAIGLILMLDFMRSTFKTIDDVERGLSIPVLGSLAHLETEEQRRSSTSKRRRAAVVVGIFLVLLVTAVTIYYVYPARLPGFARDLFDLLLGPTG